jgi:hypothetical protein
MSHYPPIRVTTQRGADAIDRVIDLLLAEMAAAQRDTVPAQAEDTPDDGTPRGRVRSRIRRSAA